MKPVSCDYCQQPAELCTGADIYPHRDDLARHHFYRCVPCEAYVGTHDGTVMPLGRLANARLRALKKSVHALFDPIWRGLGTPRNRGRNRKTARSAAYGQLAIALGIPKSECHIGMFDEERCEQALRIITSWSEPQEKRA